MKKFKKISLIVMSIMLCFTVLCQTATAAFLNSGNDSERYIKDIKLIYADSVDEAKGQLPEDYSLLENNLNEGTGELGVYICYSTTKDPEEAITDIKVMHESGGFQRTDFKASLNDAIDGVYSLAQEMTTAINEFIQNYNNGVPAAVYAKEALDYFQYDANTLLGDGNCGKGTDRLISALKARGIKNPYLHISHPHYDHRYGIRRIINDSWFKPRALYCQNPDSIKAYNGAVKSDIDALRTVIKEAKARGITVVYLKNGDRIVHGDIKFTVYREEPAWDGNAEGYLNDGSLAYWFPEDRKSVV